MEGTAGRKETRRRGLAPRPQPRPAGVLHDCREAQAAGGVTRLHAGGAMDCVTARHLQRGLGKPSPSCGGMEDGLRRLSPSLRLPR